MDGKATAKIAEQERRYQSTQRARLELEADKRKRAAVDRRHGHLPSCGLLQCVPECPSAQRTAD